MPRAAPTTKALLDQTTTAALPSDRVHLTHGTCRGATFSPDGKQIAFIRARANYSDVNGIGSGPIDTVNIDGTHFRKLPGLRGICPCAGPAWSPNGRTIALITDTTNSNQGLSNSLYTVNTNGTDRHRLLTAGQYGILDAPAWQPLPVGSSQPSR